MQQARRTKNSPETACSPLLGSGDIGEGNAGGAKSQTAMVLSLQSFGQRPRSIFPHYAINDECIRPRLFDVRQEMT
jgi:hypothetical protein